MSQFPQFSGADRPPQVEFAANDDEVTRARQRVFLTIAVVLVSIGIVLFIVLLKYG